MKCPTCGRENRYRAGFCAWCGAPLRAGKEARQDEEAGGATATEQVKVLPTAVPPDEHAPQASSESQGPVPGEADKAAPAPDAVTPASELSGGPLPVGARLAERFEVTELLESVPGRNVYRARDMRRCATCGYDDNPPGTDFCRECGAALEKPSYAVLVEQVQRAPEEYDLRFIENEHDYFVTAEPARSEEAAIAASGPTGSLRLIWGKATDPGLKRDHNEDYMEAWLYARGSGGLIGLFVVADGLGGQDSGEVASRMATDVVWQTLYESVWTPIIRSQALDGDAIESHLVAAVESATQAVYDARAERNSTMSTTLTLALVVDDIAFVANVGDSRTYVWNAKGLKQITKDHSLVQRLVDTGQIEPQEIYTHPQRNLIYQSIGDRPEVKVDTFRQPLAPDDRLVLCSDGLWEMVRNEGIEEVLLAEPDPQRACERMVRDANLAGGEDNITVIVVQAVSG